MSVHPSPSTSASTSLNNRVSSAAKHQNESKPESSTGKSHESSGTTGSFECNICLDNANDAVVSMCGHLFCWPCLHQWFETAEARPVCPVCKAAISRDKVIPLYGRGADHTQDPRTKIPPRPAGRRTEPDSGLGSFGSTLGGLFGVQGGGSGFRMAVGVGAFPFGFLATSFNFGGGVNNNSNLPNTSLDATSWAADSETLSKICLIIAVLFVACLLIA